MRTLLIVMSVVETGAGLGLLVVPSLVAVLLVGAPLEGPVAMTVSRICGAGLLSLGIACWLARDDASSRAATGLLIAMLFYNSAGTAVLAYALVGFGLKGALLWPAIVVHAALAIWCIVRLRSESSAPSMNA